MKGIKDLQSESVIEDSLAILYTRMYRMYSRMLKGQRLIENVQLNSGSGTIYVSWLVEGLIPGLTSLTDI